SPALPKPVQDPVPVIIGGNGPRRTPRLAARFAAEYNQSFPPKDQIVPQRDRVRAACEELGRDPDELVYSVAFVACIGKDEQEMARRAEAIGRGPAELRRNGLAGSPQEMLDGLGALAEQGISRVYLQCLDIGDLDHLELIAAEVLPHVPRTACAPGHAPCGSGCTWATGRPARRRARPTPARSPTRR